MQTVEIDWSRISKRKQKKNVQIEKCYVEATI